VESMKNILYVCIKIILLLLRIIFYPVRMICNVIYGTHNPNIVGYAWYSKEEYQKLIDSSDDRLDEIVPTYELWKSKADKNLDRYQKRGLIVIKVAIEMKELMAWLRSNGLINIVENRQKYVNHRMHHFLEDAII
jgi:hypothetical protein